MVCQLKEIEYHVVASYFHGSMGLCQELGIDSEVNNNTTDWSLVRKQTEKKNKKTAMEGGGKAVVLTPNNKKSVITELQTKWGELEKGFQGWFCQEALPVVETVVVTANHALRGAACGAAYGVLLGSVLKSFQPFQGLPYIRLQAARDLAVWRGTDKGMVCAMKRIRGKDDTKARVLAGFTSGWMFYVVGNPSPTASNAIVVGLSFALCHGLMHKVFNSSQPPELREKCYTRTRCMLLNLGLQKYEKHFKKHLLTDNTMPLLNKSDLVEAGIPLGPSVLILNHIERDPDLRKMRGT